MVEHRYFSVLPGFAGTMSEPAARRLAADPAVKYVEQNHIVSDAGPVADACAGLDRIACNGTCR